MLNRFVTLPSLDSARRDIPAGIVVFLVALPLCLGIALASGAPLFSGVIAGVVGGVVISLLSGSELSVSGPAAGLAVIVAAAITKLGGLPHFQVFTLAVFLSGLIQLGFGFLRAGMIGDYIPNSVIKGMLAAIGIVIVLKQIPHALGHDRDYLGNEAFRQTDELNTFTEVVASFFSPSPGAVLITVASLMLLVVWERPFMKRRAWTGMLPAPLFVVILGALINEAFGWWKPEWKLVAAEHLVTLPVPKSPADFLGNFRLPDFSAWLNPDVWIIAGTIAIVGSIETLLCLEATDRLDPEKRFSDPHRELRAQGVGNAVSGLLGGLPITSVIVRSSANVYSGGRTRLSSLVHGLAMMVAVALFAGVLNRVPLAALASILLVVGYKLSSRRILMEMWTKGATQFLPFLGTVLAIMFTDLLKGISLGLLIRLLFVIRTHRRTAILLVDEGGSWRLSLRGVLSFLNKAELKRRLRRVPGGVRLIVDGTLSPSVDSDISETLKEFELVAASRGVQIEYLNYPGRN